ncbi:MAG: hypothetical protein NUV63_13800 [Gallionella sp.]|nr:hypothetical protein [Gallionella sp.]
MNFFERLKLLCTNPVVLQLPLAHQAPLLHNRSHLARQVASTYSAAGNINQGLKTLIFDMYVRRRVVVVPHANDDAKEG